MVRGAPFHHGGGANSLWIRTPTSPLPLLIDSVISNRTQGRDAVKQLIEDTPELLEELEKKIKESLGGTESKKVLEGKMAEEKA